MSTSNFDIKNIGSKGAEGSGLTSILVPYLILIGSQVPLTFIYFLNLAGSRLHYRLFPIALLAFAILLVLRWPRSGDKPFFPSYLSLFLLVAGMLLAIGGTLWLSPWFAYASLLSFLGSLLARTNDHRQFGTLISLLAPLAVLLQPPAGIDFDNVQGDIQLMQVVNTTSTAITSDLCDVLGWLFELGYLNVPSGSRIEIPGGFLDSIDIGTRSASVFTLLIATGIYIAVMRRPLFRAALLLLACVFWAIAGEAMQMMICTIGSVSFNLDWLDNNAPTLLRLTCLITALALTLLTDPLITFLFGKVDLTSIDEDQKFQYWLCRSWNFLIAGFESPVIDNNVRREVTWARWRNAAPSANVSRVLWITAIAAAALAVFQVVEIGRASALSGNHVFRAGSGSGIALSADALPSTLLGAELQGTGIEQPRRQTAFRVRQNVWTWQDPGTDQIRYEISVTQAWPGWHDAITSHQRFQWIPDSVSPPGTIMTSGIVPNLPIVVAEFHNTLAEHSFLAFCEIDGFGEPFEPPLTWSNFQDFRRRASRRVNARHRPRLLVPDAIAIQITVQTLGPVPRPIQRRAIQLLEAAAAELQRQVVDGTLPVESPAGNDSDKTAFPPARKRLPFLHQPFRFPLATTSQ